MVLRSRLSSIIGLLAAGFWLLSEPRMKLNGVKQRTAEPQNAEPQNAEPLNFEGGFRLPLSFS